ncbi:MAG: hypothetical protein E7598_06965 [Ruminococcaceae bacterium]|nr:hypothetical protein [Oscillospiraceae bacterium]
MKNVVEKLKNTWCKFFANLTRRFDFTLSLRRKKKDENPLVSVNVKGEIPREVVAFFAIIGVLTMLWSIIKVLRKLA